ncbi:MAG: UDP-N-acetylmuramoyl-L-alanine--D-glutamate ligase [Planctomycetes bacterium]|nr:UDP-N-acetylmuramoyl-L-alanine--D-glutamate ligase [Planctomycetota bacterium]
MTDARDSACAIVLGLGLHGGGVGVARHLHARGRHVRVLDRRDAATLAPSLAALADIPLDLRLGEHRNEDLEGCDLLVPNPAIPVEHPLLVEARRRGIAVRGEIDLLIEALPQRCIAITGTNGKSTTTTWIAFLLERCGVGVRVGGNLGISLLDDVAGVRPDDWLVLEVSSFQLEALRPTRPWPDVAVWTNLSPDHLDRHGDMAGYARAKDGILRFQAPHQRAILNGADPVLRSAERPGLGQRVWIGAAPDSAPRWREDEQGRLLRRDESGREELIARRSDLPLRGAFQGTNALMALAAVEAVGVDPRRAAAHLSAFPGVAHRLRPLGERGGRFWIDNGVSTTPTSTISALEDAAARPLYWIGGGKTKHLPLEELARAAASRCTEVLAFGAAAEELAQAVEAAGGTARRCADLPAAMAIAARETPRGACVLFSPAFASFDAYPHFRVRAEHFLRLLEELCPSGAGS